MVKILYIEDNEDNVYMLKRRLTRKGFDMVIAGDGLAGVAMAHSESPRFNSYGFEFAQNGWVGCNAGDQGRSRHARDSSHCFIRACDGRA